MGVHQGGRPRVTPRPATAGDIPALVRLINSAYRVESFFVNGDRTTERDLKARISSPGGGFLVIGPPAGELEGAVFVEVQGDRGHFGMLAVDPTRQNRGIGRTLVGAAEDHCRTAGCRVIELDVVNLRRELPAFYASLGYTPVGTAPFPDPGKLSRPAHLVVMSKPLQAADEPRGG